jgi:hypothetical protein
MKKNLPLGTAALGLATALLLNSCAYDPNFGYTGGTYSTGYGGGSSYGGSTVSSSVFVSTGDPRWGYDPHTYCYYDNHSRRYYDPYLNGYYPVNYCPPVVVGVPHPHGWRPGRSYCPPPHTVRNVTVVNYRNRENAYRSSNHSWAHQVHERPAHHQRPSEQVREAWGNQGRQMPSAGFLQNRPQNQPNSGHSRQTMPSGSQLGADMRPEKPAPREPQDPMPTPSMPERPSMPEPPVMDLPQAPPPPSEPPPSAEVLRSLGDG